MGSQFIRSIHESQRSKTRVKRNSFICYPEDRVREVWESLVSVTLLMMCVTTPIYISFNDSQLKTDDDGIDWTNNWFLINTVQDLIFGIDIAANFI